MYYVGIDISNDTFTATMLANPNQILFYGKEFNNTLTGFIQLDTLLSEKSEKDDLVLILESTGVYGEQLCTYFYRANYRIYTEPPQYVRRAFRLKRKSDKVDSKMIAEYGYRYSDQLHTWEPRNSIYEEVISILNNRELFVKQRTAHKNIIKALIHKEYPPESLKQHQDALHYLEQSIKTTDELLKQTIMSDSNVAQHIINLKTMPGVGYWWSANFFVITNGFHNLSYRKIACYVGIVPHEYTSGTSVKKHPRSDRKGSDRMRKALYLSSMSVIRLDGKLRTQYLNTIARGKPKRLAQNNIAAKMLKIACAIVRDGKPYEPTHKSINPLLLEKRVEKP